MYRRICGSAMAYDGRNTPTHLPKTEKSLFATGETCPMPAAPIPWM